jgi:DNA repair protein RadC
MRRRNGATPAPWVRVVRDAAALEAHFEQNPPLPLTTPVAVATYLRPHLESAETERFIVLALNTQHQVVWRQVVSEGLVDCSLVHPRECYRLACTYLATGIVVAHNHPSGNPAPSADDRAVTRQLVEAGRVLDIPLYDHVIIGRAGTYFSFAEAGLL